MNKNTIIADYFKQNFPIEQLKRQMYNEKNIYDRIPTLSFRFPEDIKDTAYLDLKACVECFSGNLQWTIFINTYSQKGLNRLLIPKIATQRYIDMYEKNAPISDTSYFSPEEYKELCDKAIADIPALYEHIRNNFKWKDSYKKSEK